MITQLMIKRNNPGGAFKRSEEATLLTVTRPGHMTTDSSKTSSRPVIESLGDCVLNSLEDFVKQMAMSNIQFQQNVYATIQDLQSQISQLATTLNQLHSKGSGKIPSQIVINPQENVCAITLRSGKELQQ
ncbi:hypothetical protein CR513_08960, partial [Mucuna pruriens]